MKKLFAFILAFLYLGIATGFSTYTHYCMDRYVETTLWQIDMSKCGACGMSKDKSSAEKKCCKEEHKQLKLEKDHKAATEISYKYLQELPAILLHTDVLRPAKTLTNIAIDYPFSHAPPDKAYHTIYMLNCIYRI
ncbi:hypothetical protein H8S90_21675 [Olivibacter sp. SDN3]|uniref:HYC_CC_PP family protein n=1 Tax=Olivibacter sp. SDN3 TaxID=2764720 RepID=UPI001651251B|nr:hypothetical protein [Olivibacter sp. SDN3]QNL49314.1 hypothetical protein H8S90_21675 [Olivibacter sp. SDN3]